MGLLRDVLAPAVSASSAKVTAPAVPDAQPLPDLPEGLTDEEGASSMASSVAMEESIAADEDTVGGAAPVRSHRPETIATSWRGLVDELLPLAARKNLLGE